MTSGYIHRCVLGVEMSICLPQHNELSILHWHFGGGGGGDVFLLRGVHWARLIGGGGGGGEAKMGEIQQGEGHRKGKGGEGRGEVLIEWSTGGEEEKEGEGSAEPQLHPLMLHVSVSRSTARPALQSDKERINTKIRVFI